MYRFRPSELFRTQAEMDYQAFTLPNGAGRYLVVDDFYADPLAVRRLLLTTPYPAWERDVTGANLQAYSDCRQNIQLPTHQVQDAIRGLCQQALGIALPRNRPNFVTNLFRNEVEPPVTAQPRPHDDGPSVAAIVMLNLPEECAGGTAFYCSRNPPVACMPTDPASYQALRQQIYLGSREEARAGYFLDQWEEHWQRIATVEMKFNRLLLYPGLQFHGHWHVPGSFTEHWRLNQTFFFDDPVWAG
ncbi:DUF6445 family protein [Wenzhouxiangella marina]|uniref:Uncharacterized protein n=1 Tax=Wenzhouxiangella marina TaxID=1579979 RepID=A0A0K0XUM8_9GAMM|nr:DUF6445 family protein [Wenzhouxiangella marina]AKS41370.1 hypothetical protein WM2015_993 [Wenzhouxiangella marina]MBB6086876.1 hypothetical protein [Wenzhouxiangella marina]